MATHCSILAWETPWTEETNRLQPKGHKEWDTQQQKKHLTTTTAVTVTVHFQQTVALRSTRYLGSFSRHPG